MSVAPGRPQVGLIAAFAGVAASLVLTMPWKAAAAGWEAWGGLLVLALAGASSSRWRLRPSEVASRRIAARVGLFGLAFAAGALARGASPLPLAGLLATGLLAQPRASAKLGGEAVVHAAVALLGLAAGRLFVSASTLQHATQLGGALAVGAFGASLLHARMRAREDLPWGLLAMVLGVAIAAWALR